MTKDMNSEDLYQEILAVFNHYAIENESRTLETSPVIAPNILDPYRYQAIPSLYETVPTTISNRT